MGIGARSLLAAGLGVLGASCFDGADALGLPCRSDADCGQAQRCEQGSCGGPPSGATATETGPGASSGTQGSSSGSTSDGSSTEPTTTDDTSPLPGCGNGVVEPELDEACDPGTGVDEATCNADCTAVVCGDGYRNAAAGEECDDANDAMLDDCTPQCRTTLYWDDMSMEPALTGKWLPPEIPVHQYAGSDFSLAQGWEFGAPVEPNVWYSGPYSADSGTARLITAPIEFPADPGPGFRYELRLHHRLLFDDNVCGMGDVPSSSDGGVVWIVEMPGDPPQPAGPPSIQGERLTNPGNCAGALGQPDNPLFDPVMPRPVYAGNTGPAFVEAGFPLPPDVAGRTVHLVFEIGYDCRNCWGAGPQNAGWTIDDVVVAAFPVPG